MFIIAKQGRSTTDKLYKRFQYAKVQPQDVSVRFQFGPECLGTIITSKNTIFINYIELYKEWDFYYCNEQLIGILIKPILTTLKSSAELELYISYAFTCVHSRLFAVSVSVKTVYILKAYTWSLMFSYQ